MLLYSRRLDDELFTIEKEEHHELPYRYRHMIHLPYFSSEEHGEVVDCLSDLRFADESRARAFAKRQVRQWLDDWSREFQLPPEIDITYDSRAPG